MRSIRVFAVLVIIFGAMLPKVSLASEFSNNDINTNIVNIQPNNFEELILPGSALTKVPTEGIFPEAQIVTSEADERLDQILAKWKNKQLDKWNMLPDKPFIVNASAYTAAADECGNSKGITSSGLKVQADRTIACPQQFPFGAKIAIDGMGTYVCEDRGGAIKGNHIDIYMQTKQEAFAFGRQSLTAHVIIE
jgi:3D (Asp-Asp-Asp) domain-containing protein